MACKRPREPPKDSKEIEVVEEPWEGRVFVDQLGNDEWMLTHGLTHEKIRIKTPYAELQFVGDGGGSLITEVAGEKYSVEPIGTVLHKHLFSDEKSGELFISEKRGDATNNYSLDDLRIQKRDASVTLSVNHSGASFTFDVYVFRRPRFGKMFMFWSCTKLYRFLGLDAYNNTLSCWVWNQMQSWEKVCMQVFGETLVVQSCFVTKQTHRKATMPFAERCLPSPSISTLALVFFAARWAFLSREVGGLSNKHAQTNAEALVKCFISMMSCGAEKRVVIEIYLDPDWRPRWPRPAPFCGDSFKLVVASENVVGVSDLQAVAWQRSKSSVAVKWWDSIKDQVEMDGTIPFEKLLKALASRVNSAFFVQLVFALAARAENAFDSQAREGAKSPFKDGAQMNFNFTERCEEDCDDNEVNLQLAQYAAESQTRLGKPLFLSVAVDKGTPAGLPLYNSCLVERTVEGSELQRPSMGDKAKGGNQQTGTHSSQRQLYWLQRGKAPGAAWRPIQLNRVSARRWCDSLDNVIKTSTRAAGLSHFTPDETDKWSPANWRAWPFLSVTMDLGSDGLSGCNGLLYRWRTNLQRLDDSSHGANCDVRVMLKGMGLWSYWLLQMVSFNVPFGPHQDDQRYLEIREMMSLIYETHTPDSCALFKSMAGDLAEELKSNGFEFKGKRSPEVETWEEMKKNSSFVRVGQRLTMSRFQDSVRGAELNLGHWHRDLFERTIVCLEHDWLKGAKLQKLLVRDSGNDDIDEGAGTTSSAVPRIDDKVIRSAAQNAVCISALLLGDLGNRRLSMCVLVSCEAVKKWHGRQNKELRSTSGFQQWFLAQVGDNEFLRHIEEIIGKLSDRSALERIGCMTSISQCKAVPMLETVVEDDYAEALGQMILTMVGARLRRCCFMYTWPLRMQRVLRDGDLASKTVSEFADDVQVWKRFEQYGGNHGAEQSVRKRHLLTLTANRQLMHAHDELGYQPHEEITQLVKQRSLAVGGTQIVEEMIGIQKGATKTKGRKFRRPETAMHKVITSALLQERHKYNVPHCTTPLPSKTLRLPPSAFRPDVTKRTLRFQDLVSTSSTPAWHSPSASNVNALAGDLALLRAADEKGAFHLLQDSWLGVVGDAQHMLAARKKMAERSNLDSSTWYILLHHWPDGAVVAWPADAVRVLSSNMFYLELRKGLDDIVHLSIFDWDEWESVRFVWRSWLWQVKNCSVGWINKVGAAIRPFLGQVMNFQQAVAEAAFWNLSKVQIEKICRHLQIPLQDTSTLASTLFGAVKGVLQRGDQETCNILAKRVASLEHLNRFSDEMMELDAAIDVMEHHDHEQVKAERKHAGELSEQTKTFRREFQHKLAEVRASAGGPKKRKKGAAEKKTVPTVLTQAAASKLLPPGGFIWVGWTRREWHGHYPPHFKRTSASWDREGEHRSCMIVLKRLWEQHCMVTAMPWEDVPVDFSVV